MPLPVLRRTLPHRPSSGDVRQQRRIEKGVQSGTLTNHEVSHLERGDARIDYKEALAGRDGHVSKTEQRRIQRADRHESRKIFREKHDTQNRKG